MKRSLLYVRLDNFALWKLGDGDVEAGVVSAEAAACPSGVVRT
jgi:hypothetical protein